MKNDSALQITPELLDSIHEPNATWPHDPAVPDLPPLPVTDDPSPVKDSFLTTHYYEAVHPPKAEGPPLPLRAVVTEENPLKVDVFWSMRSPYSYLALQRLVWLNSNYNVDVNIRPVMPVAVRSTKGGSGKAGGLFGIQYKLPDAMWDTVRQGQYLGVPFRYAVPDPIWQTVYPPHGEGYQYVHPPQKQPYIHWVTRLACYAAEQGKAAAHSNLGFMYGKGQGVPQDWQEAANWGRRAAEQGLAVAQYNLAVAYGQGKGVPKDYVLAHMWANLAAAQGEEKAIEARDAFETLMTPAQFAEAQRLAREWTPKGK